MLQLTLIILACNINASTPDKFSGGCHEYEEVLNDELQETLTPYSCMMRSPIYLAQFMEKYPGMTPKRWTCKLQVPYKKV